MLIRGKAKWAKVVGDPHWGYENKFKEWSMDVYVDEPTEAKLKAEGLGPKIKNKGNGPYITFKRKEFKPDGSLNRPIRIVDHKGTVLQIGLPEDKEYVKGTTKIGNDSIVNVNFAINEYKGQKSASILSLQVWNLVKFGDEFPTREDDETASEDDWSKEVEDNG